MTARPPVPYVVCLRLDASTLDRLDSRARAINVSRSLMVRHLLDVALAEPAQRRRSRVRLAPDAPAIVLEHVIPRLEEITS